MALNKKVSYDYQYKVIDYPANSFKISGISHYQHNAKLVQYSSNLYAYREPNNPYDSKAIMLTYDNDIVGYVPKSMQYYVRELLEQGKSIFKVINIKSVAHIIGIRVIAEEEYQDDFPNIFAD